MDRVPVLGSWHDNTILRSITITQVKGVIVFDKSLYSPMLAQESSSYVVPGLRYEGRYKFHSIFGTIHY